MEWFHVRLQLARHLVHLIEGGIKYEILVIARTREQCNSIKCSIRDALHIAFEENDYTIAGGYWRVRFMTPRDQRRGVDADCIVTVDLELSDAVFHDLVLPLLRQERTQSVHITRAEIEAGETQLKSVL